MDDFLRYPGIKQKKRKSKKVSCVWIFLGSSQAYRLKIGLPDFRNLI